jgi:hypothetical protein
VIAPARLLQTAVLQVSLKQLVEERDRLQPTLSWNPFDR